MLRQLGSIHKAYDKLTMILCSQSSTHTRAHAEAPTPAQTTTLPPTRNEHVSGAAAHLTAPPRSIARRLTILQPRWHHQQQQQQLARSSSHNSSGRASRSARACPPRPPPACARRSGASAAAATARTAAQPTHLAATYERRDLVLPGLHERVAVHLAYSDMHMTAYTNAYRHARTCSSCETPAELAPPTCIDPAPSSRVKAPCATAGWCGVVCVCVCV